MFSVFGGIKKREPLITFKKKSKANITEDSLKKSISQVQQQCFNDLVVPILEGVSAKNTIDSLPTMVSMDTRSPSSSSSIASSSTLDPMHFSPRSESNQENSNLESLSSNANQIPSGSTEDDSIFDFPDSNEGSLEVKVMIASTRAVPKLKRKKSKIPKTGNKCSGSTKNFTKEQYTAKVKTRSMKQKPPPPLKNMNQKNEFTELPSQPFTWQPMHNQSILSTIEQPLMQEQYSFDIFDFDPEPQSHQSMYSNYTNNTSQSTIYPNDLLNPTTIYNQTIPQTNYYSFSDSMYYDTPDTYFISYESNNFNAPNNTNPLAIANLLNNETQLIDTTNFLDSIQNVYSNNSNLFQPTSWSIPAQPSNQNKPTSTPKPPLIEKKRKRNLVAHLKTATGETDDKQKNKEFDFSDEDEFMIVEQQESKLVPLVADKEQCLSPQLSHAERMELELESIMRSEFGGKKTNPANKENIETTKRRPQYQPLNRVNVKVTFQKRV